MFNAHKIGVSTRTVVGPLSDKLTMIYCGYYLKQTETIFTIAFWFDKSIIIHVICKGGETSTTVTVYGEGNVAGNSTVDSDPGVTRRLNQGTTLIDASCQYQT